MQSGGSPKRKERLHSNVFIISKLSQNRMITSQYKFFKKYFNWCPLSLVTLFIRILGVGETIRQVTNSRHHNMAGILLLRNETPINQSIN